MNKNKIIIAISITIVVVMGVMLMSRLSNWQDGLASPISNLFQKTPEVTPTPSPTPKTFKFDSTTDLKKELDSINPTVEESDFEDLKY